MSKQDFDTELREILEEYTTILGEGKGIEAIPKSMGNLLIEDIKQAISERLPDEIDEELDAGWNVALKQTRERLGLEER